MPSPADSNHPSALHFPSHVDIYIETELATGALCGPFNASPFTPQFQINPVMTTPKRNSRHTSCGSGSLFPTISSCQYRHPKGHLPRCPVQAQTSLCTGPTWPYSPTGPGLSSVVSRPQARLQATTCMPCWLALAGHQLARGILFWHGRTIRNTLGRHVYAEGHWSCHRHSQPRGHPLYCLHRRRRRGPAARRGPTRQKTLPGPAARDSKRTFPKAQIPVPISPGWGSTSILWPWLCQCLRRKSKTVSFYPASGRPAPAAPSHSSDNTWEICSTFASVVQHCVFPSIACQRHWGQPLTTATNDLARHSRLMSTGSCSIYRSTMLCRWSLTTPPFSRPLSLTAASPGVAGTSVIIYIMWLIPILSLRRVSTSVNLKFSTPWLP